jgi:predicted dehydrogenase
MSNKIRLGILGGGGDSLIGVLHRVAANMFDKYQIIGGCFNPDPKQNKDFADQIGVNTSRVYDTFDIMVSEEMNRPENERIQAVSVLTPNFLHYPMAKKIT